MNFTIRLERCEPIIFVILTTLLLWPVWSNTYFLTLDGPCHLYNASLLLDFWRGTHTGFLSKYYQLNHHIDPNWFSHIILACLMRCFSPQMSEKIFITFYILGFLFFSRRLILYINSENRLLVFLPFLFVYTHVFQMGFYNFSFSLVWMMAWLYFFLRYKDSLSSYYFIPIGAAIILITYLAHPIGYMLAVAITVFILFIETASRYRSLQQTLRDSSRNILVPALCILPSFLLMISFILSRPSSATSSGFGSFSVLSNDMMHLSGITNVIHTEDLPAKLTFFLFAIMILISLLIKILSRRFCRYDALLIMAVLLTTFYLRAPNSIGGVGTVFERYQILPFIILPFWFASISFPKWLAAIGGLFAIVLTIWLMCVRIPVHKQCSEAVAEYMSVGKYIKDESCVLPLNYSRSGNTITGASITDRIWMFFHASDYLGTKKNLIMMGNYEANTGFFPILWQQDINIFAHLSKDEDIEGSPPKIDIARYEANTNTKIDYVILLCLDSPSLSHPNTVALFAQLNKNYLKIFTSEYGRAILYRRNERQ